MYKRVLIVLCCLPVSLYAASDFDRGQIKKRIAPLGDVRLQEEIQEAAEQEKTAVKEKTAPDSVETVEKKPGQEIYEQYCQVCHQVGVAGAPKFRLAADWKKRLAEKKLEGITMSAIKGLNAMPPKGTCMQCSKEDIKAAVEYMVPQT